jgi:hypothetical protein
VNVPVTAYHQNFVACATCYFLYGILWEGKINQHEIGIKQNSSNLKMEGICSSETLVEFHRTTKRYIPEDRTFEIHPCENLKSNEITGGCKARK